jgi:hypothetical protein
MLDGRNEVNAFKINNLWQKNAAGEAPCRALRGAPMRWRSTFGSIANTLLI